MGRERVFLKDDGATEALGTRLAGELKPGSLLLLSGGLGAGKTSLARALIRSLSRNPDLEVPSPSFALVQPYEAGHVPVLHADLYRISDPREVDELGLFDRRDAIVIVEWPERDPNLASRPAIAVTLGIPSDGRGRVAEIDR